MDLESDSSLCLYVLEYAKKLPFDVPLWLVKWVRLMLENPKTRLTGPVLSCERDVHVSAYAILVDIRAIGLVLHPMQSSCEVGVSWDDAVDYEVKISTSILDAGYAVAGMYPRTSAGHFTNKKRKALHRGEQELLRSLGYCENVMRADCNSWLDHESIDNGNVLYKYGGDMMRSGLFSKLFVDRVHARTIELLDLNKNSKSDYQQKVSLRFRPFTILLRNAMFSLWRLTGGWT